MSTARLVTCGIRRTRGACSLAPLGRDGSACHDDGEREGQDAASHSPPSIRERHDANHSDTRLSRSAFAMTDTELKLIAAAAIIGDSSSSKNGYATPAAIGTPAEL